MACAGATDCGSHGLREPRTSGTKSTLATRIRAVSRTIIVLAPVDRNRDKNDQYTKLYRPTEMALSQIPASLLIVVRSGQTIEHAFLPATQLRGEFADNLGSLFCDIFRFTEIFLEVIKFNRFFA